MKKLTGIKVTTYDAGDDFRVDIVDNPNSDYYEAYLYKFNFSKFALFGLAKGDYTKAEYTKRIETELDDYKEIYDNDFMRGYRYDGLPDDVDYDAEIHTDTFHLDDDWMVDIVEKENEFEAWLYRGSMGVKSMMFGFPKFQDTSDGLLEIDFGDFLGMVYGQWEEHAKWYDEDYE